MNITTKTQLKNHKFKALRVIKGFAIEDIPKMRANLLSQIEGIPDATMTEGESSFNFSNGQFVLKPKQQREQIGILDCGPTFARFDGVRIEYSDMAMNDCSGFETRNAQYAIHAMID